MSVIIMGMEMPKHGDVLVVREYNGKTYIKHEGHLGFEARLIELPPHGRLIDADAIQDYNVETFGQRLLIIDTAPTVIEAEE